MTRNDFMTSCTLGMCSCAASVLLPQDSANAQSNNPELDELRWKLDAAQKRFAKLVGILNQNLDGPARKKIFESLGRECAQDYRGLTDKYKGDLKGFLGEVQKRWVTNADYDEKAGTLRIVDKASTCTCPLVKPGLTPPEFCNCTLGWQKETYSAILGKPVDAEVEESILRGGKRCVFRIRIS